MYSDSKSWRPCGEFHDTYGHFWIEVGILGKHSVYRYSVSSFGSKYVVVDRHRYMCVTSRYVIAFGTKSRIDR